VKRATLNTGEAAPQHFAPEQLNSQMVVAGW
jgi:hypothetical protein